MTVAMRLINAALQSTRAVKRMRAEYRFIIGGVLKESTYYFNHFLWSLPSNNGCNESDINDHSGSIEKAEKNKVNDILRAHSDWCKPHWNTIW